MERTPAEDLAILALIGGSWTAAEIHEVTDLSIEMIDQETSYHYWYDPRRGSARAQRRRGRYLWDSPACAGIDAKNGEGRIRG